MNQIFSILMVCI